MSLFTPPAFLASANIYCVNLRQYSKEGNFKAFARQIPRLKDMGVQIIWFMPLHPIGIPHRKGSMGSYYSISDFKAINPEFGTAADFKQVVEACHALGIKVIMDWVANHAAWDNVWTKTHPDFFEQDAQGHFKPPFDWDDVIQINHSNPRQQEAMTDAMLYWIKAFDIDGFRADLAHLTPLAFWINARKKASAIKSDLIWLAETENINYHQAFDISFTWQWMHLTESYSKGQAPFQQLKDCLQQYRQQFPAQALRMWFTSNHDENSWNGTAFEKYGHHVKALSVFNATYPGIPLIYSGEEDMLDKRLKFFDKDAIEWKYHYAWHMFYRTLLRLRQTSRLFKAMDASELHWLPDADKNEMLAYYRSNGNDVLIVLINISPQPQHYNICLPQFAGLFNHVFTGEQVWLGEQLQIALGSGEFLLLSNEAIF